MSLFTFINTSRGTDANNVKIRQQQHDLAGAPVTQADLLYGYARPEPLRRGCI